MSYNHTISEICETTAFLYASYRMTPGIPGNGLTFQTGAGGPTGYRRMTTGGSEGAGALPVDN